MRYIVHKNIIRQRRRDPHQEQYAIPTPPPSVGDIIYTFLFAKLSLLLRGILVMI